MFLGLRTVVYQAGDLERAKAWYSELLGIEPYFDQPFYVGYNVSGYELGLVPAEGEAGAKVEAGSAVTYWGVEEIGAALARILAHGASERQAVQDVGEGIRVAAVLDPFGNVVGLIENPHFKLPAT